MTIPRATLNPAASNGISSPSTHAETGNPGYAQTNGNGVGPTPKNLHATPSVYYSLTPPDTFLMPCLCACPPLHSCCIHSNFFYRLTMNHLFVWVFSYLVELTLSRPRRLLRLVLLGLSALCTSSIFPYQNATNNFENHVLIQLMKFSTHCSTFCASLY